MTVTSQSDDQTSGAAPDLAQLLRPVVRESSVSEVAKRLLDHLSAGDIKPGTRLPAERQLAEALGVARSSVRGALSALDVLGIIEIRPGSGSYVREGTSEFLPRAINWGLMLGQRRTQDLVEVRTYLEAVSARLAAERATDEDLERLAGHLQHMRAAAWRRQGLHRRGHRLPSGVGPYRAQQCAQRHPAQHPGVAAGVDGTGQ